MVYHKIAEDAKRNTHAKVLIEQIHKFADDNKEITFKPGCITVQVLKSIYNESDVWFQLPETVTLLEMRTLIKVYLTGINCVDTDDDHFEIKIKY
jgi:hypothetical protein